jgi:hypothetical protein
MTEDQKETGFIKSQHVALKEIYSDMTRKQRREWIKENVPTEKDDK